MGGQKRRERVAREGGKNRYDWEAEEILHKRWVGLKGTEFWGEIF